MPEPRTTRLLTLRWDDESAFCRVTGDPFPAPESLRLWQKRRTSRIYHAGADRLMKVCLVQSSPRNPLLRLIGQSRAEVERDSGERLRALGLRSPRVLAIGSVLNPVSPVDSLLVEELVPDSRDALHFLADATVPVDPRAAFIDTVLRGLESLIAHRLALRDFRLCNLLISGEDPTPIWIDADVKPCGSTESARRRLLTSVRRVWNKDCPAIPPGLGERLAEGLAALTDTPRPRA